MWLVFLVIILGLALGTTLLRYSPVRSALAGAALGIVIVFVINVASPTVCLQQSKGWRILTAYKTC